MSVNQRAAATLVGVLLVLLLVYPLPELAQEHDAAALARATGLISHPGGLPLACAPGGAFTLDRVARLYATYRKDLAVVRARARAFCDLPTPPGWQHNHRCQYSAVEMELLYLFIRDEKPARVLELCSAVGYTTTWVLSALVDNGGPGELWGLDVYDTAEAVSTLPPALLARWHFTKAFANDETVAPLLHNITFDRIIMDADHTPAFAEWYTKSVLSKAVAAGRPGGSLAISVHDIYDGDQSGHPLSGEGDVVVKWVAAEPAVRAAHCLLLNPIHNPRGVEAVAAVRKAALGGTAAAAAWGKANPECSLFLSVPT